MKSKVTFNRSGSGSVSGRVILPVAFLGELGITEDEREVNIIMQDNKIIIEKVDNMKNLVGKTWGEITEEQKEKLLRCANAIDGRTGDNSRGGPCIVDFDSYDFSIPGELVIGENEASIEINDNAVFYGPSK